MAAREANLILAGKLLAALPKNLRDESEVIDKPGKGYTLLKVPNVSTVSVRDGGVRIVHPCDVDSAADVKKYAALIAEAVREPVADDKPAKKAAKKAPAKKLPKGSPVGVGPDGDDPAVAQAAAEAAEAEGDQGGDK